jgi:hypothetical protein
MRLKRQKAHLRPPARDTLRQDVLKEKKKEEKGRAENQACQCLLEETERYKKKNAGKEKCASVTTKQIKNAKKIQKNYLQLPLRATL